MNNDSVCGRHLDVSSIGKKTIAIIAVAFMVFASFYVITDVSATSDSSNVIDDAIVINDSTQSGQVYEGITYDKNTYTLTLNNATVHSKGLNTPEDYRAAVYIGLTGDKELHVKVTGTNTIVLEPKESEFCSIGGLLSLNPMIIEGADGSSLNVKVNGNDPSSELHTAAIYCVKGITIQNMTVFAHSGADKDYVNERMNLRYEGIYSESSNIAINSSNVTVDVHSIAEATGKEFPNSYSAIRTDTGNITITDSNIRTCIDGPSTTGAGLLTRDNNVTIKNSTLKYTGSVPVFSDTTDMPTSIITHKSGQKILKGIVNGEEKDLSNESVIPKKTTCLIIDTDDAPIIDITSPVNGNGSSMTTVTGTCDLSIVKIKVNDGEEQEVYVWFGEFSKDIELKDGKNTITVTADDGFSTTVEIIEIGDSNNGSSNNNMWIIALGIAIVLVAIVLLCLLLFRKKNE